MKKINSLMVVLCLLISSHSLAQTSTEDFETESNGSTSFTDKGVVFNIISHKTSFMIQEGAYPGTGWNGTYPDNRYIDNTGSVGNGASFSIKTTSNLFKVNRFWISLSHSTNLAVPGTLIIAGKLNGVTKYSKMKTDGFTTSIGTTMGYTLIDFTNLEGQDCSDIIIDELRITLGAVFTYAGFDAFTWEKESGVVLAADDVKNGKNSFQIYPNPTSDFINFQNPETIEKVEIYDLSGKLLISSESSAKVDVSKLEKGTYIARVKTEKGTLDSKFIKN